MDLYTRKPDAERQSEIVGWAMRDNLRAELATSALIMAIQRQKPPPRLIAHSDRGVQYACTSCQAVLAGTGMRASMSRTGDPFDNAPMESFFKTLKTELADEADYATHNEARRDLFAFIEV